jgi:tetratricopeptide (TPR) repeat protein
LPGRAGWRHPRRTPNAAARPDSPEALLARADALRDARDWPAAEAAYRDYLARRPEHWQIHVQLGHALKEQGRPDAALAAYAAAEALSPAAFDPPFQLAHLLRTLGRGAEAARAFSRALAAAPEDALLRRQVFLFRHRLDPAPDGPALPLPAAPEGPPTSLAFDVTDLLDYLRDARTPTGIQRVQMGLLGAILETPGRPATTLLAYDPSAWRWWQVEEAAFRRALALSRDGAREDDPPGAPRSPRWSTPTAGPTQRSPPAPPSPRSAMPGGWRIISAASACCAAA